MPSQVSDPQGQGQLSGMGGDYKIESHHLGVLGHR